MGKNGISIYTTPGGNKLNISFKDTRKIIDADSNKLRQYYDEIIKLYELIKILYNEVKDYADKNSDVTIENLDNLKVALELQIMGKQPLGNYALVEDLPENLSELFNDSEFINKTELNTVKNDLIETLKLPSQSGCENQVLTTDGENLFWKGFLGFNLFDTKLSDYVLDGEEALGWALQGTYVYKEAIAGSHYGYPDFYAKCLEEYNEATTTETVNGVTVKVHSNGHKFYDIANKDAIDSFYNATGFAWFYGVDIENERVFLPRNNWFEQATGDISEVGLGVEAGLPNIDATWEAHQNSYIGGGTSTTGAVYVVGSNNRKASAGDNASQGTRWGFDASLSNPIYGKSSTVQPNAVKKLLYICVGNTTNYEGMTDVVNQGMEILEQVAQKVNVDGTNLNTEGKSLISSFAFPSNRYIDLTLGASGTTYTAPANGYIGLATYNPNTTGSYQAYISIFAENGVDILGRINLSTTNFYTGGCMQPIKKGQKFIYFYETNVRTDLFRFIYAEGEV